MGYYEVLNWLVNRRASGDESYHSIKQIYLALDKRIPYVSIANSCGKLEYDGHIEGRMSSDIKNWLRTYRATRKNVEVKYG